MSAQYTRDHVKISVVKILQTIGWHSINSTPLEVLTDILSRFLSQLTRSTNEYANEFGQTEPNLDHLALAFRDMGISLGELEEYVTYVNFAPPPTAVPKYPVTKENHLNFLKPGSKEVVTRPVHIHEHLPPMFPLIEGVEQETEPVEIKKETEEITENGQIFKKPAEISPTEFKRTRREEEGSRPTREISSVMMTTSGFLSPAREGKLPEAKTPIQALIEPPVPNNTSTPPPDMSNGEVAKKIPKTPARKIDKKKDRVGKELFKSLIDEKPVRKSPPITKELAKMKQKLNAGNVPPMAHLDGVKMIPNNKVNNKINKTLADARMKTEKLNTTITPIPLKPEQAPQALDKINTEPDKKKANIFRKISNVKNEKHDLKMIKKEDARSRGGSPNLVIDERDEMPKNIHNMLSDVTIEPIPQSATKSPDKMDYFDDGSPPGTPSTPKTPEMISHSPPLMKEKRKRKENKRVKKVQKQSPVLPIMEPYMEMERPKTPEAQVIMKEQLPNTPSQLLIPPLFNLLGGPGLIPNPMFSFPHMHPSFGKSPLFPSLNPPIPNLPNPLQPPPSNHPPPRTEEPPVKQPRMEPQPQLQPPSPIPEPRILPEASEVQNLDSTDDSLKPDKKTKEHKKEKKDKIKKKNKKDKIKDKSEKKKLKEEKKVKEKIKKEKKEKRKDKEAIRDGESPVPKLFLKLGTPSPRPETPDAMRKLNIKPIVKKEEEAGTSIEERQRETSPGLAKIAALVTGPPKPKPSQPLVLPVPVHQIGAYNDNYPSSSTDILKEKKSLFKPISHKVRTKDLKRSSPELSPIESLPLATSAPTTSMYIDADGKEIWICPACNKQDDGSPMIGCDGCDAWYHWVCVKIQVPPDENENWYCKHCLPKNNEDLQSDKKKKRKKREKKEH